MSKVLIAQDEIGIGGASVEMGPSNNFGHSISAYSAWQGVGNTPLTATANQGSPGPIQSDHKFIAEYAGTYTIKISDTSYSPSTLVGNDYIFLNGVQYWTHSCGAFTYRVTIALEVGDVVTIKSEWISGNPGSWVTIEAEIGAGFRVNPSPNMTGFVITQSVYS